VMNQSSDGHLFQFRLTPIEFLGLSSFWNFSYAHSRLARVNGHAAGVVLNAVDASDGEAWSFYWGVVPEFRGSTISLRLVANYLNQIAREGFRRTWADISDDSPVSIYERLGFEQRGERIEMERSQAITKPVGNQGSEVIRAVSAEEALQAITKLPASEGHWAQRPATLRSMAPQLQFVACFGKSDIDALAACSVRQGGTAIMGIRSLPDCPSSLAALIHYLACGGLPPPVRFSFVSPAGPAYEILRQAEFTVNQRFRSLALEMSTWRTKRLSRQVPS